MSEQTVRDGQNMVVIWGPGGAGKSSLKKALIRKRPGLGGVVNTTTRPPRKGEVDTKDYYFRSLVEFQKRREEGCFLEYDFYDGNLYGLELLSIEMVIQSGLVPILDATLPGVKKVREVFPAALVFGVTTRDVLQLVKRLQTRGMSEKNIIERITRAKLELVEADRCCDIRISAGDNTVEQVADIMLLVIDAYLAGKIKPLPL